MANGDTPAQTIQAISKSVYLPISLVIGVVAIAMYIGTVNADVNQTKKDVLRLEANIIPRPELDLRLRGIEDKVNDIQLDVKSILKQGR